MWVTGLLRRTWRKKGHPAWKHSGSGVVFLKPGFPSFPLTSAQAACESVTVQGMIQTQVRKKVKYLVHSCSVFIFIVVQGSSPSFPPCLFWSWHTSTHPSPHTLPTQTDRHTPFLFVGYNSRRQAFGSLIFKMTLLTLPPTSESCTDCSWRCRAFLGWPFTTWPQLFAFLLRKPSWRMPWAALCTPGQNKIMQQNSMPFPWGRVEAHSWGQWLG